MSHQCENVLDGYFLSSDIAVVSEKGNLVHVSREHVRLVISRHCFTRVRE